MSVFESDTAARPAIAETRLQIGQEFAHPPSGRDNSGRNPYSPVGCILLLLIAGLIIEVGPTIHAYLAHN
jgi:hypothetical protein